jgi:hypothetical protein
MGNIYSTARHTMIFLGTASPECNLMMQYLESQKGKLLHRKDFSVAMESSSLGRLEPLIEEHILSNPWFTRVWILQELILSSDPWVQCGAQRLRWDLFCNYIFSTESSHWRADSRQLLTGMNDSRAKFKTLKSDDLREDDALNQMFEILKARRGSGVSDPRDMIFAHLGLIKSSVEDIIPVDYGKSTLQLYEDLARYYVNRGKSAAILTWAEGEELYERREGLPTWVPDWTKTGYGHHSTVKEIFSTSIPHVLAIVGWNRGSVKAIIPEDAWPGFGYATQSKDIQLFKRWKTTRDSPIQETRQHVFNYYRTSVQRNWERMVDRRRSGRRGGWHVLFNPTSEHVDLLLPIVSTWSETVMAEGRKSEAEGLIASLLRNLIDWKQRYTVGFQIAVLEGGYLVQVPNGTRAGDIVATFQDENSSYILRPCTEQIVPKFEEGLKSSLEQDHIEFDRRKLFATWDPYKATVRSYTFVSNSAYGPGQALDSYRDLLFDQFGYPERKKLPKIFALH